MKRISSYVTVPLALLALSACPERTDGPAPEGDRAADPDAAVNGEVTPGNGAVCLEGGPFAGDGPLAVNAPAGGDADAVGALRWEAHEGCERFVIDLEDSDGAPAGSAGRVSAEVLRDLGVVRVTLREVLRVDPDASDADFGGELARAAYSVWAPEGRWSFVDLHLAGEAEASVTVLAEPARVVVDLRPGGGPVPGPAPTHDHVVVLEPRPGTASYPLTVTGYARTFEANVLARIERDGQDAAADFTTATAWVDAWGHYTITFANGPSGPITLHVGEHSARDGTWEGAAIELEMR